MPEDIALRAFLFGLLSAASLPLGALAARFWTPGNRVIAALMAFGGGALLAALTIDLVGEALDRGHFYPLAIGCLIGGALFVVLNLWLNTRGGFLRKVGTTINYLKRGKSGEFKRVFKELSRSPLFNALPADQIHRLIPLMHYQVYPAGRTIMRQGEVGDRLHFIDTGQVGVVDEPSGKQIAELGPGDVMGEMALVTGEPRLATVKAKGEVAVWTIQKSHFDRLIHAVPAFNKAIGELMASRIHHLREHRTIDEKQANRWYDEAEIRIEDAISMPSNLDVRNAAAQHSTAPVAIWLGIFLDGIPESLVIGSSMLHATFSLSLIASLFLSNFPEAFSSSMGMREQNYSFTRIMTMWTSLMLFTGIGAWLGSIFFVGADPTSFSLVEGIAAGAMLTVIAETMLPEAYHRGGKITGFSTLLGFLTAIFFTTLE